MATKPNILFVFSDQQHWQAVGFEDASFTTPNLDRLASEGTVFTQSFCTTPQCSPSRSSIVAGLYPSKTGVLGNVGAAGGNPLRTETIGAVLQRAGYRTAYFGKWHLGKEPIGIAGWDEDFGVTGPETTDDLEVTRRALDFLERHQDVDQPFALFLSYNNPHDIYHFGRETEPVPSSSVDLPKTWHNKDLSSVPPVQEQFMREDQGKIIYGSEGPAWKRYREIYREKVKLYDDEVGKVLTTMDTYGLDSSTLIIATSDHGDMDGQHQLIYKGPFMYDHMMRVPLIVRLPASLQSSATPKTITAPVVNVDPAPTIADFAGTTLKSTDGFSLKPCLTGEGAPPQRDFVIGEYYSKQKWVNPIRMIRTEDYKYNLYRVHGDELYDLRKDPLEISNCVKDNAYADAQEDLSRKLSNWITEHQDPFPSQEPTTRDGGPLSG